MYQPKYYTLTFMVRKAQTKKSGEVPVFARITISGQRTEFSLNRSVKPKDRNPATSPHFRSETYIFDGGIDKTCIE